MLFRSCGRWISSPASALCGASSSIHRHWRPRISAEVPWASSPWSAPRAAEPPNRDQDEGDAAHRIVRGGARRCRSSGTGARRLPARLGTASDPRHRGRQRRRRATDGNDGSTTRSTCRRTVLYFCVCWGLFCNVSDVMLILLPLSRLLVFFLVFLCAVIKEDEASAD